MPNQVAMKTRQSLLHSIHSQIGLISALVSHKIAGLTGDIASQEDRPDAKVIGDGEARFAGMTINLSLGEIGASIEYGLSLVAHAAGPIWIRISRQVGGSASAPLDATCTPGVWKLLSDDGDLSQWKGDLWPAFWPVLMRDMEGIVNDKVAPALRDGDLRVAVRPDPDFWVLGQCRMDTEMPLVLCAFDRPGSGSAVSDRAEESIAA